MAAAQVEGWLGTAAAAAGSCVPCWQAVATSTIMLCSVAVLCFLQCLTFAGKKDVERSDLTLTVLHGPAGPEGAALAQEEPAAVA